MCILCKTGSNNIRLLYREQLFDGLPEQSYHCLLLYVLFKIEFCHYS